MARETIFPSNPGENGVDVIVPTVIWHRDQFVTLGTRHTSDEHDEHGLWADLDRRQVNRLIATLKRARDAAFGADE